MNLLIEKLDIKTPGRQELNQREQFYTKKYYKEKMEYAVHNRETALEYQDKELIFLECLGRKDNIESVTNYAARLRLIVKDTESTGRCVFFKML